MLIKFTVKINRFYNFSLNSLFDLVILGNTGIFLINSKYLVIWETIDMNGLEIVLFNKELGDVFV